MGEGAKTDPAKRKWACEEQTECLGVWTELVHVSPYPHSIATVQPSSGHIESSHKVSNKINGDVISTKIQLLTGKMRSANLIESYKKQAQNHFFSFTKIMGHYFSHFS